MSQSQSSTVSEDVKAVEAVAKALRVWATRIAATGGDCDKIPSEDRRITCEVFALLAQNAVLLRSLLDRYGIAGCQGCRADLRDWLKALLDEAVGGTAAGEDLGGCWVRWEYAAPRHTCGHSLPDELDRWAGKLRQTSDGSLVPWADDAPEYITLTEARKLIDDRLSMPTLSRLCKPDGRMHYMRKGQRRKVHLGDFRRYMQSRPNDPQLTTAMSAYFSAAGKGNNRNFWRCNQCGHEYPDTATADPDYCPQCKHKGKNALITKAPPKSRR
jgi:hypothetical protein